MIEHIRHLAAVSPSRAVRRSHLSSPVKYRRMVTVLHAFSVKLEDTRTPMPVDQSRATIRAWEYQTDLEWRRRTPRSGSCRMATTRSRDFLTQVVQYDIPLSNACLVFLHDIILFIFVLVGYINRTPSIHLVIRSSSLLLHVSLVATELSIPARPILSFRRQTHRDQK